MPFDVEQRFVEQTEVELGVKFPAAFVARMRASNGGEVVLVEEGDEWVWFLYPFFDDLDRRRLRRTCNDIVRETRSAREWSGFPQDGVAIANDGSGNQLLFLPHGETRVLRDEVFVWDHETSGVRRVADELWGSREE